jgi:hypothetical protein
LDLDDSDESPAEEPTLTSIFKTIKQGQNKTKAMLREIRDAAHVQFTMIHNQMLTLQEQLSGIREDMATTLEFQALEHGLVIWKKSLLISRRLGQTQHT